MGLWWGKSELWLSQLENHKWLLWCTAHVWPWSCGGNLSRGNIDCQYPSYGEMPSWCRRSWQMGEHNEFHQYSQWKRWRPEVHFACQKGLLERSWSKAKQKYSSIKVWLGPQAQIRISASWNINQWRIYRNRCHVRHSQRRKSANWMHGGTLGDE